MDFKTYIYDNDFELYLETYSPDPKKDTWQDSAADDSIIAAKFANDLKLESK